MWCYGIPSVIVTTNGISDSIASKIAFLAKRGGTNMTEASGLTSFLASATDLKTGNPKCYWP